VVDNPAQEAMFEVNGKRYPIPTSYTLGEMIDAERYFGVEFNEDNSGGIRMAAALLWIAMRREDPRVTVEQIRELPPDVFAIPEVEDDARPPEPQIPSSDMSSRSSGESSDVSSEDSSSAPRTVGVPG
jgi:hypothetical protein